MPSTNGLALAHKWANEPNFIAPVILDPVIDVDHQDKWLILKCESHTSPKFSYSVLLDTTSVFFYLGPLQTSLEGTIFSALLKDLEELQDQGFWLTEAGQPLRAKALTKKLQNKVFQPMTYRLAETRKFSTLMEPVKVSLRTVSCREERALRIHRESGYSW